MFPKARKEAKRKVIEHPKQNTSMAQEWFSLCPAMGGSDSQTTHFRAGRICWGEGFEVISWLDHKWGIEWDPWVMVPQPGHRFVGPDDRYWRTVADRSIVGVEMPAAGVFRG